jgi:peptide/nickel transport system permease protein
VRFLLRRLAQFLPTALIMTALVFAMTVRLPGDAALTVLGEGATEEQVAKVRADLGLDDPVPVQYVRWLGRVALGDFGRSLRTREPVGAILAQRVPVTLQLTLGAMLVATACGIPLGVLAARNRNGWIDAAATLAGLVAMAIPYFWLGLLLILGVSVGLGLLPPSGYVPFAKDPVRNLMLMVLPVLTIGLSMTAVVMRQTRASMIQALSQDYVRTARAKGAGEGRVVGRHVLPNALNPVVTVIGLQTGALLGGAVVTETVFSLPGLGKMLVDGILNRDFPVVQGAVLVVIAFVLVTNLVVDVIYGALDPRISRL